MDKKLQQIIRILNHEVTGRMIVPKINRLKEEYEFVIGGSFLDIVMEFILSAERNGMSIMKRQANYFRSNMIFVESSLQISPNMTREEKSLMSKLMTQIYECIDYDFMNSVFTGTKTPIVYGKVPVRKKRGAGRPSNKDSPEGNKFFQLFKDAAKLWDAVSGILFDFIEDLKLNNYRYVKPVSDAGKQDGQSRSVRGFTVLFHLFTHRMLDKDGSGHYVYDVNEPPVCNNSQSVLKFDIQDIDEHLLVKDSNGRMVPVWEKFDAVSSETIWGTNTLKRIIEGIENDASVIAKMKTDQSLHSPDKSPCVSFFVFLREILVMNKEKRWWHLEKLKNYARQQPNRALTKTTVQEKPGMGISVGQRLREMQTDPDILKLHLKAGVQISSDELTENYIDLERSIMHSYKVSLERENTAEKINEEMKMKEASGATKKAKKRKRDTGDGLPSPVQSAMVDELHKEMSRYPIVIVDYDTAVYSIESDFQERAYWIERTRDDSMNTEKLIEFCKRRGFELVVEDVEVIETIMQHVLYEIFCVQTDVEKYCNNERSINSCKQHNTFVKDVISRLNTFFDVYTAIHSLDI
jgi:hypothetical protein